MRQKRAKAYKKLMHMYTMTYGFRTPYQVLVDADMCAEAIATKMDLVKHIGIVLHGEVKPMITQCSIVELYKRGPSAQPAVDLAKMFERRRCNHREAIAGDECLQSVVGASNKHRYVIASQSQPLRAKLRAIPAVPLVHVSRSVMILEPPSDETLRQKALNETRAMQATSKETSQAGADQPAGNEPKKKKRKGPKGPNPLSMKKKKPKQMPGFQRQGDVGTGVTRPAQVGEKRKRHGDDGPEEPPQKKRRQVTDDAKARE